MRNIENEQLENRNKLTRYVETYLYITLLFLFLTRNSKEKYIFIISGIFQIIALFGLLTSKNNIIEITHVIMAIFLITVGIFFNSLYINIYILLVILVIGYTRIVYDSCLFYNSNVESENGLFKLVPVYFTEFILVSLTGITIYKLVNIIK